MLLSFFITFFSFLYLSFYQCQIPIETKEITGDAILKIIDKKQGAYFGKPFIQYKATILAFKDTSNRFYYDLPIFFTTKPSEQISADYLYLFKNCEITQKNKGEFKFKIPKEKIRLKKKISFVEARFKLKNKVRLILEKNIQEIRVLKFFQAMSLGYSDFKLLSYEFSKAGIQHLLTISGFHFALVFMFIFYITQPIFKTRATYFICGALLFFYMLYLGDAPSISRAWIAILIYLICRFFEVKANSLNALSIALILAFIQNPFILCSLGFQLSFAATFGIIGYYSVAEQALCSLIPKKKKEELCSFGFFKLLFCFFMSTLRKGLALDFAVNLTTIPLIFYYFGSFPLFSFFYNLIIPLLLTPSLFLLLITFAISPIEQMVKVMFSINEAYTKQILNLITFAPKEFEIAIFIKNFSEELVIFLLFLAVINLKNGFTKTFK